MAVDLSELRLADRVRRPPRPPRRWPLRARPVSRRRHAQAAVRPGHQRVADAHLARVGAGRGVGLHASRRRARARPHHRPARQVREARSRSTWSANHDSTTAAPDTPSRPGRVRSSEAVLGTNVLTCAIDVRRSQRLDSELGSRRGSTAPRRRSALTARLPACGHVASRFGVPHRGAGFERPRPRRPPRTTAARGVSERRPYRPGETRHRRVRFLLSPPPVGRRLSTASRLAPLTTATT
jgi:hypothetical protein